MPEVIEVIELTEADREFLIANDITLVKIVGGVIYGVKKFIFTWGLITHVEPNPLGRMFYHRFCYPNDRFTLDEVAEIAKAWEITGLPLCGWTKYKSPHAEAAEMTDSQWLMMRMFEPCKENFVRYPDEEPCACGEAIGVPRKGGEGAPLDHRLRNLGLEFAIEVAKETRHGK